jgi:molybdate transport system permease protein
MTVDPASAIRLSVVVGCGATALGLAPAVALGWLLARRQFRGKALLSAVILAPLVLPPVVTGLLLLELFGQGGPLGPVWELVGVKVPFSLLGALAAALVVGFPLYVVTIRSAFEAVDPRYEEVALTLGMSPRRAWWRVSVPLALPGIAGAAVLAFARGLGEFGATAVLAGNIEGRTRTISLAVYSLLDSPDGDAGVRVLVVASIAISLAALLGAEALNRWQRRRLEVDSG